MIKVFIGWDGRQPISFTALSHSIINNSSQPVAIIPLVLPTLPIKRQGLTPFTFSRFLVPWLCDFSGSAIFLDADIMLTGDVAELFALGEYRYAVQVVKHEGNLKFERASVILFNNEHPANRVLTPEFIETADKLHHMSWCKPEEVGDLPMEWNQLCGYYEPNSKAKLLHYTQGVPIFPEVRDSEQAELWLQTVQRATSTVTWKELMGTSVHARPVIDRLLKRVTKSS